MISFLTSQDRIALVIINSNYTYFKNDCDYTKELIDVVQLEHVNLYYRRALNNYIDTLSADTGKC